MSAWIFVTDEQNATGELKRVYDWVKETRGSVSNVMKVHGLDPDSIRLHMSLYLHLLYGRSTLTRLQREMIAVVVSESNKCDYCITHHTEALQAHSKDRSMLENLKRLDFANLSPKDRAMLEYAVKLTRNPQKIMKSDLDSLKTKGFSDEEILRINLIVSYFNFVNRIVAGLGVALEEKAVRVYNY